MGAYRVGGHWTSKSFHEYSLAQEPPPVTGVPLPRVRWQPELASAYLDALRPAALHAACAAAEAGDVAACFELLHAETVRAAVAGGMQFGGRACPEQADMHDR